jgi:hypothetical protein
MLQPNKRSKSVNTTFTIVIAVFLALVILAAILMPVLARRKSEKEIQERFGPEYDNTVQALGDEKKALKELEERQKHVEALYIHPLTISQRDRYVAEWAVVQSKFVDHPGEAIVEADRLIMEVMQLRSYPVADFEQRAADLSVHYPALVSNYRAARAIAIKNSQNEASTEELRQAMIYYRSLFGELLETEKVMA